MNLVQQDTVYNYMTFELLESMVKLSRINIDRFQSIGIDIDRDTQLRSSMTSFDTGRQTGKSTAIARYLKENVIVVSPSKVLKKVMADRLQSVNRFNLCVADFNNSSIFRGIRCEFDLIFDECNLEGILFVLNSLGKYPSIKIRSIVKVGL